MATFNFVTRYANPGKLFFFSAPARVLATETIAGYEITYIAGNVWYDTEDQRGHITARTKELTICVRIGDKLACAAHRCLTQCETLDTFRERVKAVAYYLPEFVRQFVEDMAAIDSQTEEV